MTNGHGGYRKPANPAPVSGPGKYARRTDGGPAQVNSTVPDQPYGDAKAQHDAERVAPMGGKAPLPAAPSPSAEQPASLAQFAGLGPGDPSTRPNEPVTHGVDIGAGGGSDVLNLPTPPNPAQGTGQMTALLQRLSASDTTGILGQLMQAAQDRGA